jgi:hypothetical protein
MDDIKSLFRFPKLSISERPLHSEWVAVAVAFLSAEMLLHMGGMIGLFLFPMEAAYHEVGHAVMYWLRGILAVPLPIVTVPLQTETSLLFLGVECALLAYGYYSARKYKLYFVSALLLVFAALTAVVTLFLSQQTAAALGIAGGQAGEFYVSTLIIMLFHHPIYPSDNWRRARYFFLITAAVAYVNAAHTWIAAFFDPTKIPYGGITGYEQGDMNRLVRDFGWTPQFIISVYIFILLLSGLSILLHLVACTFLEPIEDEAALKEGLTDVSNAVGMIGALDK